MQTNINLDLDVIPNLRARQNIITIIFHDNVYSQIHRIFINKQANKQIDKRKRQQK